MSLKYYENFWLTHFNPYILFLVGIVVLVSSGEFAINLWERSTTLTLTAIALPGVFMIIKTHIVCSTLLFSPDKSDNGFSIIRIYQTLNPWILCLVYTLVVGSLYVSFIF